MHSKTTKLISAIYELLIITFTFLILKDWFLSAVDFYPYSDSVVILFGAIIASWLILNSSCSISLNKLSIPLPVIKSIKALRLILAWLLTIPILVLLLGFALQLKDIPWNDNTILGMGLGSQTLSTAFINKVTSYAHVSAASPIAVACAEYGWLTVICLGLLCLCASIAASINIIKVDEDKPRIYPLVLCGYLILCTLLFREFVNNVFLSLNAGVGSCLLFLAFALIGMSFPNNVKTVGRTKTRTASHKKLRIGIIIFAAIIIGFSISQYSISRQVAVLKGTGQPSIMKQRFGYEDAKSPVLHDFTPIAQISQPMIDATIAMEDHNFYSHHGVDWEAIHRALRFNLRLGEVKQGGSTITQQLAKNLFLSNDRNVLRKLQEALYAAEIERQLSKNRILELYLNTIDYGMGQHGITAASQYYFKTKPKDLNLAESGILVGIVPDPMQKEVDQQRLMNGQQTALGRITFFFPQRYTQDMANQALALSYDKYIYPFKNAWDRGATEEIPATWHGVGFYFFASPDQPLPIEQVSKYLKDRMPAFLDEARRKYHIIGLDHLGVYNDRATRQNANIISAHAFGQAIDISGFRFKDGSHIMVIDHTNPKVMAQLKPLEALLNRHFDAVVDWNDDPKFHQNHFHTEVKGVRSSVPRPVPANMLTGTITLFNARAFLRAERTLAFAITRAARWGLLAPLGSPYI